MARPAAFAIGDERVAYGPAATPCSSRLFESFWPPYTAAQMHPVELWPACGHALLAADAGGGLRPTDAWWRLLLGRPELALVAESCRAERRLHLRLSKAPSRAVPAAELAALQDGDTRDNYRHWLAFRDALTTAGTLQAWLLQLFRSGRITLPPLFIDLVVQAIVCDGLQGETNALAWRAAELLFRPQRLTRHDGRLLAGDRDRLDLQRDTGNLGTLGRLLTEAQVPLKPLDLAVLGADNGALYFERAAGGGGGGGGGSGIAPSAIVDSDANANPFADDDTPDIIGKPSVPPR